MDAVIHATKISRSRVLETQKEEEASKKKQTDGDWKSPRRQTNEDGTTKEIRTVREQTNEIGRVRRTRRSEPSDEDNYRRLLDQSDEKASKKGVRMGEKKNQNQPWTSRFGELTR